MKTIEVEFVTPSSAMVRGYGSRDLLTELTGRAPVWATLSRAWACQTKTAKNLIAVAESRGYDVVITEGEKVDPGGGRW